MSIFKDLDNSLLQPITDKQIDSLFIRTKYKPRKSKIPGLFKKDIEPPIAFDYINNWVNFEFESDIQKEAVWQSCGDDPYLLRPENRFNFWMWGQGSGKSTFACIVDSYYIFFNEHLVDWRAFYGKKSISTLDHLLMSCDSDNATDVILKNLKELIRKTFIPGTDINWYENEMGYDLRDSEQGGRIMRTNKIIFPSKQRVFQRALSKSAPEGLEIFCAIIDECSHASGRAHIMKSVIDTIRGNVFSRYPKHGKIFFISYPNDDWNPENDYMRSNYPLFKKRMEDMGDTWASVASVFDVRPSLRGDPGIMSAFDFDEIQANLRYNCISPMGKYPLYKVPDVNKIPDVNYSPVVSYHVEEIVHGKDRKLILEITDMKPDDYDRIIVIDSGEDNFTILMGRVIEMFHEDEEKVESIRKLLPSQLENIHIFGIPYIDCLISVGPAKNANVDYSSIIEALKQIVDKFSVWALYSDKYQLKAFEKLLQDAYIDIQEINYGSRMLIKEMILLSKMLISQGLVKVAAGEDDYGQTIHEDLIDAIKSANKRGANNFISTNPHIFDTFLVFTTKAATELAPKDGMAFMRG